MFLGISITDWIGWESHIIWFSKLILRFSSLLCFEELWCWVRCLKLNFNMYNEYVKSELNYSIPQKSNGIKYVNSINQTATLWYVCISLFFSFIRYYNLSVAKSNWYFLWSQLPFIWVIFHTNDSSCLKTYLLCMETPQQNPLYNWHMPRKKRERGKKRRKIRRYTHDDFLWYDQVLFVSLKVKIDIYFLSLCCSYYLSITWTISYRW
jgi:hypothetical protein